MTVRLVPTSATVAVLISVATGVACSPPAPDPSESRPNLVLILADDLGFGDVGVHGSEIPTPEIDRLAAAGVRFTQAYVTASVCAPSRAGILTGRYQNRFGFEFNILETGDWSRLRAPPGLPVDETTLAEVLAGAGYTSAIVGKWHLGMSRELSPLSSGFDEFFGTLFSGEPYLASRRKRALLRGRGPHVEGEYLTDAFTREAVDFIARNHERPFFLFLSYTAVHTPMEATRASMQDCPVQRGKRRRYCGMLRSMDDGVGRVLSALKEHGVEDETLVVFTNDNGGSRKNFADNRPLRGFKGEMYEGGLRVPMFMRWPGRVDGGTLYAAPVSTLDIFATFLASAGIGEPPQPIDGVDLLPFLSDPDSGRPHPDLFWRRGKQSAVRSGDWKLVRDDTKVQLFNLAKDPGEKFNLRKFRADRVAELKRTYAKWESEMVEPMWKQMKPWAGRPSRRGPAK